MIHYFILSRRTTRSTPRRARDQTTTRGMPPGAQWRAEQFMIHDIHIRKLFFWLLYKNSNLCEWLHDFSSFCKKFAKD